jgi:hypothetical protein
MLVVLCFSMASASATTITIGPISMSGSGSYSWTYGSGPGDEFIASGSFGVDTASLSIISQGQDLNQFVFPGLPTSLSSFPDGSCDWSGLATIDGISGGNLCSGGNTASWSLGDGGGSISILDSGEIFLANLVGYLQYTNETETFNGTTLVGVTASFDIVPTPEPASWGLCLAGLTIVAFRTRSHQRPQ